MSTSELQSIVAGFAFEGELQGVDEIKTGHINRTYRLTYRTPGGSRRYLLQRINTVAFHKPREVMENICGVTEHLRRALERQGIDPENRVLRVVPARGGGSIVEDGVGGSWRAYDFIEHAKTVDKVRSPEQFREIGRAFGAFQNMLADYPIHSLHDTIPDFHNTVRRLETFERSVRADAAGRAAEVQREIAFVRARRQEMGRIVEMIDDGVLPLRVTHNDTKINNVMLDEVTGEALCVVDLDTVMAGSVLYDFGDAIRYGASTAAEDETDLDLVTVDMRLFEGFSEGFIAETARSLTLAELENLPLGALVMTYEVGFRFLADYLDGDVYFRIDYPAHNLDRARNQFRLLEQMEARREEMDAIVNRLIGRCR